MQPVAAKQDEDCQASTRRRRPRLLALADPGAGRRRERRGDDVVGGEPDQPRPVALHVGSSIVELTDLCAAACAAHARGAVWA